jgi:hypothetical protein
MPAKASTRAQPGPPMTLANKRANGVRMVIASCDSCGHAADVNVDPMLETVTVPQVGLSLQWSQCGAKTINTRPAWHSLPSGHLRQLQAVLTLLSSKRGLKVRRVRRGRDMRHGPFPRYG